MTDMASRVATETRVHRVARTTRHWPHAVIGFGLVARCTDTLSRVQAARHGTSTKRLHMEASPHRSSSHVCSLTDVLPALAHGGGGQ